MATLGGIRSSQRSQNDDELKNLARFAVNKHNKKENAMIEFVRVVEAKEQLVAGTLHYLTVEAIDASKKKLYEAKVWVKPWLNFKELQEFKHASDAKDSPSFTASDLGVKQDGHGLGLKAVPTHDPVVQDADERIIYLLGALGKGHDSWFLSMVHGAFVEKDSSLIAQDGKTRLEMLSFEAPRIRLLQSMNIEGEAMQPYDIGRVDLREVSLDILLQRQMKESGTANGLNGNHAVNIEQMESFESMANGDRLSSLVDGLNDLLPDLRLPLDVTKKELRHCLIDGAIFCAIFNKDGGPEYGPTNVKRFLIAIDEMGLPSFELSDIEQGHMMPVLKCLKTLRACFNSNGETISIQNPSRKRWSLSGEFESIQLKQGGYADLPEATSSDS